LFLDFNSLIVFLIYSHPLVDGKNGYVGSYEIVELC